MWNAFWALSSDRQLGMAEGYIPWTAVDRYATRYGIDDLDEFEAFRSMISALDSEYLKLRAPKRENKNADES